MTDIQTIAHLELDQHLEQQSPKVAPQAEIKFIDIDGFYNFEAQVNSQVIANISINTSQKFSFWEVEVSGVAVHRCNELSQAKDFIKTSYTNGTLQLHREKASISTREERAATIEVLEKHGNEYLVHNCENNHYYIVRPHHSDAQQRCECPDCYFRGVTCKHQIAVANFNRI
jgi:hypothetical protein